MESDTEIDRQIGLKMAALEELREAVAASVAADARLVGAIDQCIAAGLDNATIAEAAQPPEDTRKNLG